MVINPKVIFHCDLRSHHQTLISWSCAYCGFLLPAGLKATEWVWLHEMKRNLWNDDQNTYMICYIYKYMHLLSISYAWTTGQIFSVPRASTYYMARQLQSLKSLKEKCLSTAICRCFCLYLLLIILNVFQESLLFVKLFFQIIPLRMSVWWK